MLQSWLAFDHLSCFLIAHHHQMCFISCNAFQFLPMIIFWGLMLILLEMKITWWTVSKKSAVVLWTHALHIQTDDPSRFYHLYSLFLRYLLGIFSFVQIRFCFLEFARNIFICLLNFISHLLRLLIFYYLQKDHLWKNILVHFLFEFAYFSRNIVI